MQYRVSLAGLLLLGATLAVPDRAAAQQAERLGNIEAQIRALQAELRRVKAEMAARDQAVSRMQADAARSSAAGARRQVLNPYPEIPPGYALIPMAPGADSGETARLVRLEKPARKLPQGTFEVGGVRVTVGGFLEAAAIFRSRNEVGDISSNFNTAIPLPNNPLYHENEFRLTARQSRASVLAEADVGSDTLLTGYLEADFQGAAPTANSVESNSYNPRLRHAYAVYDDKAWGVSILGGQTWSLLTMSKKGIPYLQSDYNIPLTIDAQYVPGFVWTRQAQVRVVKSFDHDRVWLAAAVENPQQAYYTGPNGVVPSALGTVNVTNPGGPLYANTNNYSDDIAPDVVVKAALDPGWGHFEVYGIARFFHDRLSRLGGGRNNTVIGGGGGASALLPIIPKYLILQASLLAGRGIGRYGAGQLPDAVVGPDGSPDPIGEVAALVGVVSHPVPSLDLYAYGGTEQSSRRSFASGGKGYGYGSPLYSNLTCEEELAPSSGCVGNTSGVWQATLGGWWRFAKGPYGTMQVGPQYSYTHRSIFSGQGPTPSTDENIVMLSFRYYPFQ